MSTTNRQDTRSLNTTERLDAVARIGRYLAKHECKAELLSCHFVTEKDEQGNTTGETVLFMFKKELKGFSIFNGSDFVDLPNMVYTMTLGAPMNELNDYRILAKIDKPETMTDDMCNALEKKLATDLFKGIDTLNLLPFTKNKKEN